jgi:hypothetical protein
MNIERYSHVMHISPTVWFFFFCVDNIFMTYPVYTSTDVQLLLWLILLGLQWIVLVIITDLMGYIYKGHASNLD